MSKQDYLQTVKQKFGIVGNTPDFNHAISTALQVAPTDISVFITGESGVGKETFPKIIHQFSYRKHGAYIAVNCGSIPEGTIDSELFGHEKGSFTGAVGTRKGYFEVANGGTLFLDEVGELPLSTQARLLRVLETGEFIKVGSSVVEKTNVRVVAATNVNIINAIKNGKFREDLYYRLNTVPIRIPSLKDRKEDIPILFRKFSSDASVKYSIPPISLTESGIKAIEKYDWPGNIRQLKNITEQISILETEREISSKILSKYLPKEEVALISINNNSVDASTFTAEREIVYKMIYEMKADIEALKLKVSSISKHYIGKSPNVGPSEIALLDANKNDSGDLSNKIIITKSNNADNETFEDVHILENIQEEINDRAISLKELEKDTIKRSLERNSGNKKIAAQELKITERTLYRKIKEYGLESL